MGADIILDNFEDLAEVGEDKRDEIIAATKEELFTMLKEELAPEFLNRIDERIVFTPLTRIEIKKILKLVLRKTVIMLKKKGMEMEVTDQALDLLADLGYDPQFGARPIKRVLQRELVNELSIKVISGEYDMGDTILVDADKKGKLVFTKKDEETKKKVVKKVVKKTEKKVVEKIAKKTEKKEDKA